MTAGILITNYNTWALTSQSIINCLKHADLPVAQFVVVDDCSVEPVGHLNPEVQLLRNEQNLGLIRSLNKGLRHLHTDLVFIFDSDAWPLENYLSKAVAYFQENPQVGIATFQTENANGEASPSFEAEPGALSLLLGQQLYQRYLNRFCKKPENINVFTCAMVVRRQVLDEVGYFDENFDWLELDHDFCMRATRQGWRIGVMPIRAMHKGSGTPQLVSHRVIRFYKNRWYLLQKYNKVKYKSFYACAVCLRLSLELLLIWIFGKVYFQDKLVVQDKFSSRKAILKYFALST